MCLPVAIIDDIKIEYNGAGAFSLKSEKYKEPFELDAESLYLLIKGLLNILNRNAYSKTVKYCYDVSDDFDSYYNRVSVLNGVTTFEYWEKDRNPEIEVKFEIENSEKAKNVALSIIDMINDDIN